MREELVPQESKQIERWKPKFVGLIKIMDTKGKNIPTSPLPLPGLTVKQAKANLRRYLRSTEFNKFLYENNLELAEDEVVPIVQEQRRNAERRDKKPKFWWSATAYFAFDQNGSSSFTKERAFVFPTTKKDEKDAEEIFEKIMNYELRRSSGWVINREKNPKLIS